MSSVAEIRHSASPYGSAPSPTSCPEVALLPGRQAASKQLLAVAQSVLKVTSLNPPAARRDPCAINFHSIADLIRPAQYDEVPHRLSPEIDSINKENQTTAASLRPASSHAAQPNLVSPVRALSPRSANIPTPMTSTPVANSNQRMTLGHGPAMRHLPSLDLHHETFSPILKEPHGHHGNRPLSPSNRKKGRTIYKTQQVHKLEEVFAACHYPETEVTEALAAELGITETKIKVWFQNKRARLRRRLAQTGRSGEMMAQGPAAANTSPPMRETAAKLSPPAGVPLQPIPVWPNMAPLGNPGFPALHPVTSLPQMYPGAMAQGLAQQMGGCFPPVSQALPPAPYSGASAGFPPTCTYPINMQPRMQTRGPSMHPSPLATLNNLPQGLGQA